ncbi:UNVERIFIED_CONTAM: hypothetical protein ACS92_03470 [Bacillus cereus]
MSCSVEAEVAAADEVAGVSAADEVAGVSAADEVVAGVVAVVAAADSLWTWTWPSPIWLTISSAAVAREARTEASTILDNCIMND